MRLRLYERGDSQSLGDNISLNLLDWQNFQQNLWHNRLLSGRLLLHSEASPSSSPSPYVYWQDKSIQAQGFVGFLAHGGLEVEVLPRYFQGSPQLTSEYLYQHLAYLLSYSPSLSRAASLGAPGQSLTSANPNFWQVFFEKALLEQLENQNLGHYPSLKAFHTWSQGKLDIKRYTQENLPQGAWQRIPWERYSAELPARLYGIMKAVIQKMRLSTRDTTSHERLETMLQYLAAIPEYHPSLADFEQLGREDWHDPWPALLDYAEAYWQSSSLVSGGNTRAALSWMVPMERLFEEFVAGFLTKYWPDEAIQYQKNVILGEESQPGSSALYVRPDLWFPQVRLLIDTKYKYLKGALPRPQAGDIYQILTYAQVLDARQAILLYPRPGTDFEGGNRDFVIPLSGENTLLLSLRFIDLRATSSHFDPSEMDAFWREQFDLILRDGLNLGRE